MNFLSASWLSFKDSIGYLKTWEIILNAIFTPSLGLIQYCLVAQYSYNTENLSAWIIGNSFLMSLNTSIFVLGNSFTADRFYGRMNILLLVPTSIPKQMLQKMIFPSILSIISVISGFIIGNIFWGVDFSSTNFLLLLVLLFTTIVCASMFGLLVGIFGLITDGINFMLNLISSILVFLSGANFPIEQLPKPFRYISNILPLTYGIEGSKLVIYGTYSSQHIGHLVCYQLILSLCYLMLGIIILEFLKFIAKKYNTIAKF